MMSHITLYCRECPDQIRTWIDQLQQREHTDVVASSSTYGSRKVFFDRVWGRIHIDGKPLTVEADCTNDDNNGSGGENNDDDNENNSKTSTPIIKDEFQAEMEAEDAAVEETAAISPAQETTTVEQETRNNDENQNEEDTASVNVDMNALEVTRNDEESTDFFE